METNFMGREGFIWAVGVVEDRYDPLYLGRCRVRYLGWHTRDKQQLPTSTLPWSFPLMPITSASQTQVGTSPTGPVEGTWILGFFKDGEDASDPIMLGTLPGRPDKAGDPRDGFNDPRTWNPKPFQIHKETGEIIESEAEFTDIPQFPLKVELDMNNGVKITERTDDPAKHEDKELWDFAYNFPNIRFLNEPTTPRLARGFADASAKLTNRILPGTEPGSLQITGNADSPLQLKKDVRMPTLGKFSKPSQPPPLGRDPYFREPESPYDATYPYNHVHQSESGHVIEIDDTPTSERLHWMHRSGSYKEMGPTGDVVDKSNRDMWSCVMRDRYDQIGGNKYESIDYGYELAVAAKGGSEDLWLRVCGRGDVHLEAEDGNLEIYTHNGVTFINAKRIEFNAKESIKLNAPKVVQGQKPNDNPSLNPSDPGAKSGQATKVAGDREEEVSGTQTLNAGTLALNAMGGMSMSAQGYTQSISHSAEEVITGLAVINQGKIKGKTVSVQNGIIDIRSADLKKSSGIILQLNELPAPSIDYAKKTAGGYLSMVPADDSISADIEMASLFGSLTIKNATGEISLANSDKDGSSILLSAMGAGGTATLETVGATIAIDAKGLISIKNDVTSLRNIIATLYKVMADHTHTHIDTIMGQPNPAAKTMPNVGEDWYTSIIEDQANLNLLMAD